MKRFALFLCVLAMLLTMFTFVGCRDDEQEEPQVPGTEQSGPNSDDSVVNKDNAQNDDTAADIFD